MAEWIPDLELVEDRADQREVGDGLGGQLEIWHGRLGSRDDVLLEAARPGRKIKIGGQETS